MSDKTKKILRGVGIGVIGVGATVFFIGGGAASAVTGIITALGAVIAVVMSLLE
jgi:hypothetical protein